MKAICAFCGHSNSAAAETCAHCGGSLATARRERFKVSIASWLPILPVAALLWFQFHQLQNANARAASDREQLINSHRAALATLRAGHEQREVELDQQHRATLSNTRLISGEIAAERHDEEWKRRQSHVPELAVTLLEKTLLEVERVGKDPSLTAETALRKVSQMVTPPRSRIEVKPGDRGLIIRVAFRLSAVRPDESGGATYHQSSAEMRTEIEHITAQVMKDVFDYCGARGIERLSVSCNRAVLMGKDDNQRLLMRSLYRASVDAPVAANVARWRDVSVSEAANLMRVEHDVVSGILITKRAGRRLVEDPNEPLEF